MAMVKTTSRPANWILYKELSAYQIFQFENKIINDINQRIIS
jgi:hypothetical protein